MARWQEIAQEFQELAPDERMEELIELAAGLPPVRESRRNEPRPESCRVQECQTPVYLWVEVSEGRVHVEADVSPRSPTVRGLVALVVEALEGIPSSEALSLPDNWLEELGLAETLGMTRQHGFLGVIRRIKQEVRMSCGDGAISQENGEMR